MAICPKKSCKGRLLCLGGVSVVLTVLALPTVFFYSWRDSNVNNWRDQTEMLKVYNYIHDCTSNITAEENKTQVVTKWSNKLTSLCSPYLEGACPVEHVVMSQNRSILHVGETKGAGTVLRIAVEQVNGSSPLDCSLHQLCSAVFPQCPDLNTSQHEAANTTATVTLSDSCTLHSDLLMTLTPRSTGADTVPFGGNEATTWNGSIECHPQYTPVCGLCVPHSIRYHDYLPSNGQWNFEGVAVTGAACNCVLGGVIFIALSIARRKEMMVFPTVLVFYENILEMIIAAVIMAPRFANRMNWFYAYDDVVRTMYAPPTLFCTISGFLFHFSLVAMFFLWFIHLGYVAILFKFPFFGKTLVKKARLVHAVSVPTALFLCLIGPTVTLLWCGYFTARFPNILCLPSNIDVLFYSIAAPLNILAVLTMAVTLNAVWEIHKTFGTQDYKMKKKFYSSATHVIQTSKIKLLLIAAVLFILVSLVLTRFCQNFADQLSYHTRLIAYPHCILTGNRQCSIRTTTVGTAAATTLYDAMAYFLMGGLTYVNLIFPLRPSDYKLIASKLCCLCTCAKQNSKPSVHETPLAKV